MAKTPTRPEAESEETTVAPSAHDAPGLSPFERMTELTRRIVNVPRDEAEAAKKKKHR